MDMFSLFNRESAESNIFYNSSLTNEQNYDCEFCSQENHFAQLNQSEVIDYPMNNFNNSGNSETKVKDELHIITSESFELVGNKQCFGNEIKGFPTRPRVNNNSFTNIECDYRKNNTCNEDTNSMSVKNVRNKKHINFQLSREFNKIYFKICTTVYMTISKIYNNIKEDNLNATGLRKVSKEMANDLLRNNFSLFELLEKNNFNKSVITKISNSKVNFEDKEKQDKYENDKKAFNCIIKMKISKLLNILIGKCQINNIDIPDSTRYYLNDFSDDFWKNFNSNKNKDTVINLIEKYSQSLENN